MIAHAQEIKEWGDCVVGDVATLKCLEVVFGNLITFSTAFVVLILFIMLVIGSIKYLTSGGDPEKLQGAQGTIKYALIGLMLFIGSYLILNIIQVLFLGGKGGGTSLFEFTIPKFEP